MKRPPLALPFVITMSLSNVPLAFADATPPPAEKKKPVTHKKPPAPNPNQIHDNPPAPSQMEQPHFHTINPPPPHREPPAEPPPPAKTGKAKSSTTKTDAPAK